VEDILDDPTNGVKRGVNGREQRTLALFSRCPRGDLKVAKVGVVIDAANLDEAIKLVSGSPCAVAHGFIEV
jgi:hypothetical protein